MKQLTIIIVNYNSGKHLYNCLSSLYSQSHITDFETVVVDNNSTDGSIEPIKILFPQVKVVVNGENVGFAKANNIVIANSRSGYVLLLNCDTIVPPDAIDMMIIKMENSPRTGLLGCRLTNAAGELQESFNRTPGLYTEFIRKNIYNRHIENRHSFWGKYLYRAYQQDQAVDWVSGSCMLIRRTALEQTGLLDENYFMYFEDVDLCLRMKDKGWLVRYTPDPGIIHLGGICAVDNGEKVNMEYRKSQLWFYGKYHTRCSFRLLKYYILVKTLFLLNKNRLLGLAGKMSGREVEDSVMFNRELLRYLAKCRS